MKDRQLHFSIIIPTYNRPARLGECLRALSELDYPRDRLEVIVVDDGSKVGPEAVVDSLRPQIEVTLLRKAHAGPAAARNEGANRARGEFLAFTDDDCAPERPWLRNLARRFSGSPGHAIGGPTLNEIPDNGYSMTSQALVDHLLAYYNRTPGRACFLTSNNLAVPAERFRLMGGFDETFLRAAAEDRDFCDRWLWRGYPATYAPEVVVRHRHALTLASFSRQHFNYGRGAFYFHRKRARRGSDRLRVEPLGFYLDLLSGPVGKSRGRYRIWLVGLMLMAQGANATGFVWETLRARISRRTSVTTSDRQEVPK